ncbi:MAG: restriction endonuclease subunit S [Anaerolineales bacterium]|nr:restriction endonuclease subunit S [Anaerolineales bacterium]
MVTISQRLVHLGEVCRIEGGAGFPLTYQGVIDQQYPFFKVGDMNSLGNEKEMRVFQHSISEITRIKLRAIALPAGTIIFPKIGAAIATNKKRFLVRPSCVDNNVMALIPGEKLLSSFLYYLLLNKNLSDFANTGNPPSIRQTTVEEWIIPLPPLPEQRRIAARLGQADRLRRLRRYAGRLGESYLQSVFVEMFGSKKWEEKPLGNLIDGFEAGVNYLPVSEGEKASEWRVLKVSAVTWRDFDPDESKPISHDVVFAKSHIVKQGDLLISRANTTELVGAIARVRDFPPKVLLPDKLWRVRFSKSSLLHPDYTLWALRQPSIRKMIGDLATGSSGSMKNISMEKAATLPISLPTLADQQRFARIVKRYERLRVQQGEAGRQAEMLFEGLLREAFGG